MKLTLTSLAVALASVGSAGALKTVSLAESSGIRADSDLGMALLSRAVRVDEGIHQAEGGEQQQRRQEGQEEADITWVANYSLKFQGCHHVQQVRNVN
jgi:hypothetical protein